VNAAIGYETHEVEGFTVFLGVFYGVEACCVFSQVTVSDGYVDLEEFLIDHSAGTDIEVTDLAVSHLTFGQTDVFAESDQFAVRILTIE
jgi:hypothetical protein